ncbi:MAG: DUF3800 domain-containing protein [Planktomarina sp.]
MVELEPQYTLYIDEAGDDKVTKLKPKNQNGNSEWLCIGGYLVRTEEVQNLEARKNELLKSIGGQSKNAMHYRKYTPQNRKRLCEGLAKYPSRAFVVCSYKSTLLSYRNERAEKAGNVSSNKQWLYNFIVRLLLERVTAFVFNDAKKKQITNPKIRIVMASRRGHHFGHFKAYVLQLTRQATGHSTLLNKREINPSVLDSSIIQRAPASQYAGLQMADVITSAIFQALEQSGKHQDTTPAKALMPIFAKETRGKRHIAYHRDFGLTLIPAKMADFI